MISSLTSVLNSAIRSMQTAQYALGMHSENIAHANDQTYTRKTMDPQAMTNTGGPGVLRLRDAFIDDQYRLSAASQGDAGMHKDVMSRVEEIFGDPVNGGVGSTLNQFFDAWKGLAENPADGVARLQVLSAGRAFTQQVKSAYTQLQDVADKVGEQIVAKVDRVNTDIAQIADLNKQIAQLSRNNLSDGNLRDQRDILLDDLAKLTGASSTEQPDGTVRVAVGTTPVLDGPLQLKLTTEDAVGVGPTPSWVGFVTSTYTGGGDLAGLVDVRKNDVLPIMGDIATLAKKVAQQVNALHGAGTAQGAATDFFSIGGGAVDIEVNRTLTADAVLPGFDPTAPADGERARQIAALADSQMIPSVLISGELQSPKVFYRNLIGLIGNRAQEANQATDIAKVHTDSVDRQRQSEWGVSLDEEVANLMVQQKAFAAAARVINATDQMLDYLINRTGQ
ncbi:MAG TPA: flagellar hook-associated protein FlgK [Symbiobacteriaceae bacterium]|jgi:flagellar hook-associated protein 1 FlgK